VVALTFDDGPDPSNTPRILSLLADRRARATFFVLSEEAARQPRLIDEIRSQGHEIALHGQHHIDITRAAPWVALRVVQRGRRQLEDLLGVPVRLFRPPYGTQTVFTHSVARLCGLQVVGWSASPRDFLALEPRRHTAIALAELAPGGIVLLHDGAPARPRRATRVVAALLDAITERGWESTSVGGLLEGRKPMRQLWFKRRAPAVIEEMRPLLVGEEGAARARPDRPSLTAAPRPSTG
jgi:peptidoglycan/xylan/chitin deacetylase (PgdA/CDA1 family)